MKRKKSALDEIGDMGENSRPAGKYMGPCLEEGCGFTLLGWDDEVCPRCGADLTLRKEIASGYSGA